MTKEQYEGTPELIFYCEYNPNDFEDRLEIPFTNEYDINLKFSHDEDTKEICINVDVQPKESNAPKDFFGKNILNVTAIAGKNGVGKTRIFRNIQYGGDSDNNIFLVYLLDSDAYIVESSISEDFMGLASYHSRIHDSSCIHVFFKGDSNKSYLEKSDKTIFKRIIAGESNSSLYWLLTGNQIFRDHYFSNTQDVRLVFPDVLNMNNFLHDSKLILKRINSEQSLLVKIKFIVLLIFLDLSYSAKIEDHEMSIKRELSILNILRIINRPRQTLSKIIINIEEFLKKDRNLFIVEHYYDLKTDRGILPSFSLIMHYINALDEHSLSFDNNQLILKDINKDGCLFNIIDILEKTAIHFELQYGSLSDGQTTILKQISSVLNVVIYDGLYSRRDHLGSIIVFIDEFEKYLHPEWMRKYLSFILEYLQLFADYKKKIQFIINTHSPYLISDLPKENIILLEKDEKTGKRTARKPNYGFASNYYDIMSDSFFLDDTIGEFAKQKINQVIKRLNKLSNLLDKKESKSKKINNKFMQRSQLILDHVNPIIQLIGDPFIKQQLDRMVMSIQERLKVSCQPESKKEFLEKQRAILEAQIKQIDQELGND